MDPKDPGVTVLVASSFKELVIDADMDVLVETKLPGCRSCAALTPRVKMLAFLLQDIPSLRIGIMDIEANDPPMEYLLTDATPHLRMFPKGKKLNDGPVNVSMLGDGGKQGLPTVPELLEFVHANASTPFTLTDAMRKRAEAMEKEAEYLYECRLRMVSFVNMWRDATNVRPWLPCRVVLCLVLHCCVWVTHPSLTSSWGPRCLTTASQTPTRKRQMPCGTPCLWRLACWTLQAPTPLRRCVVVSATQPRCMCHIPSLYPSSVPSPCPPSQATDALANVEKQLRDTGLYRGWLNGLWITSMEQYMEEVPALMKPGEKPVMVAFGNGSLETWTSETGLFLRDLTDDSIAVAHVDCAYQKELCERCDASAGAPAVHFYRGGSFVGKTFWENKDLVQAMMAALVAHPDPADVLPFVKEMEAKRKAAMEGSDGGGSASDSDAAPAAGDDKQ